MSKSETIQVVITVILLTIIVVLAIVWPQLQEAQNARVKEMQREWTP